MNKESQEKLEEILFDVDDAIAHPMPIDDALEFVEDLIGWLEDVRNGLLREDAKDG